MSFIYSIMFFLGVLLLSCLVSCPDSNKSSSTSSSSTYKSKLPPLKTYGISAGMSPQEVARQLEGKVEGLDQIGSKRLRNIATGELDGSYISVYTHSLYYIYISCLQKNIFTQRYNFNNFKAY